ncbi:MAG TPA: glucose-6-phosphate dehydrogenase assembly protein OpcA [Pyrinomonadaceae bacterium]|nr:glucose-6-phosphate dehydrogenase assembly protein OpcA [Pyrinomonadaceae bacterium]
METQESTIALAAAKGVDVARLEGELTAMWAEATGSKSDDEHAGVMRACVLNLVIYSRSEEDRSEVDALLVEVVERHPCRAIVLVADREAEEPRLEAYVSTRCQLSSKGARQICGEQITIEAGGPVVDSIASAVSPLLVPDVPVFLWWKDIPHYDDKLFERLSAISDRVVIDSAAFDNPHYDMAQLARMLDARAATLRLSDLNWERLTSWRSLVAGFWDVADYRASLRQIEKVIIQYDPPDRAAGEVAPKALLAVGWLASRLGWTSVEASAAEVEESGVCFTLADEGRTIEIHLRAAPDVEGRDGMLRSLTLQAADGNEFHVELRPDGTKLETCATVGGGRVVGRVLNYEARTEGQRLGVELELLSRDLIYEEAVAAAARFLESIK